MRRRRSLLLSAVLSLALAGLLLARCGGGDGDGGGDDAASQADTSGGSETSGGDTGGGGTDTFTPPADVACVPSCEGKECGDDGCGGLCAPGCQTGFSCTPTGSCVCTPQCEGIQCGADPVCGLMCGTCELGQECDAGQCVVGGDLSCPAYFVCADACDAADDACRTNCRDATAEGVGDLVDLVLACFDMSCTDCTDQDCLRACGADNCGQDYVDCFSGAESCGVVYSCVNGCILEHVYGTAFFDACRVNCLAQGTVDAQGLYLDVETCLLDEAHCDPADRSDYEGCEQRASHITCTAQFTDCPRG